MNRIFRFFLLCLLWNAISPSVVHASKDLYSPAQAAFTHVHYLQHGSYEPTRSAKTIYGKYGNEAKELARKLKLFYDAKVLIVDTTVFPGKSNYIDSMSGRHLYFPFPEYKDIYLQRINGNWYYSPHTVAKIEELYKKAVPFGSEMVQQLFGEWGKKDFAGMWLWQWMGSLLFILAFFTVFKLQWWLIDLVFIGLIFRKLSLSNESKKPIHSFAKHGSIYLLLHYSMLLIPALQLPVFINMVLIKGLDIAASIFIVVVLFSLIDLAMSRYAKISNESDSTLAEQFRPVLQKLLKTAALLFGIILFLSTLGVNLGALLAGFSIAGLAFALAAQDTVKNVLGSVVIFFDQPFKVGDWIRVDSLDGTVELVSLRSTRVRTFENSLVYIPNAKLADAMVNNYGLRVYRRFTTQLSITYNTPPALIEQFVEDIKEIIKLHPTTRKDYYVVNFSNLADSALQITVYLFFTVKDWPDEMKARQDLLLSILKIAEKRGVQFAYPTQTVYLANTAETSQSFTHP